MPVLLIYPPFAMPDKPYISVPVLAAYLRSKGIEVEALDGNIEFFRRYVSPGRMERSRSFAAERLMELNGRRELDQAGVAEYRTLVRAFMENDGAPPGVSPFEDAPIPNEQRMRRFRQALLLANAPNYPEGIEFTVSTGYVRLHSRFRKFSSADIDRSLDEPSWLEPILRDILEPELCGRGGSVIGISVAFPDQVLPAFMCAKIVKECVPDAHVTMGGTFVSTHMREVSAPRIFRYVDSLVLDEGEIPLERLARKASGASPDPSAAPGIVYRRGDTIVRSPLCAPAPMATSPAPDYSVFPLDRYLMPRDAMALLFRLSKGCYWARCSFCKTALSFIKCHEQPPAAGLYRQLESLVARTGVRIVHFTDDSASPEILEDISERMIRRGLDIRWVANVRAEPSLTLDRMVLFRQAGCRALFLGVESCNDRILKLMRKGITMAAVTRVLSNASWAGINAHVYMIVGFPTETEEEALQSFEWIAKLVRDNLIRSCVYNVFELTPHSDVYLERARYGITEVDVDPSWDLMPPASRFRSAGMSRSRAAELCSEFIGRVAEIRGELSPPSRQLPETLTIDGRTVRLRFGAARQSS